MLKSGLSLGKRVIFVFFQQQHQQARLHFSPGFLNSSRLLDLVSKDVVILEETPSGKECRIDRPEWFFRVLVED